jgi:tight adherence protein C
MEFLEPINLMLVEMLGPLGPLIAVGALGLLLVLIVLVALPKGRADPLDKLKREAGGNWQRAEGTNAQALRQRPGASAKLDRFADFLEPKDEKELSSARLKMLQAGYPSKSAVRTFHAVQFGLAMSLLVVGMLLALVRSTTGEVTPHLLVAWMVGPAFVGYYLPKYWIERRRTARQQEITEGFPDALDMMLVCVEAGQSLDQSILRVAREMRTGYPALSEEFEMVSHEVKAGKERVAVLKDMAERCGTPDVQSFVTVLVQSATFGTSIADALRVYAAEMRDKRVMRAEEKANVLPTKLTLGTMMLTVPPLMIILVGPSVYGIAQSLGGGGP